MNLPAPNQATADASPPGATAEPGAWVDRYAPALLLAILALAGLLRFYHLGALPLWIDELATLMFAERPFAEFFSAKAMEEPNPPLYYALARVWLLAFGDGEAAVRALPAVIGLLSIAAVYGLGRMLGGNKVGLVAALLLATSGAHLRYSQEARAYILLALLGTLAVWATAALITHRAMASRWSAKSVSVWAVYVVSCVLALYTHNTAVLLPALCGLTMAAVWLPRREHRPGLVVAALASHALIIGCWLFWASSVIKHSSETLSGWHIPEPTLHYIIPELRRIYGQHAAGLMFSTPIKMLIDLPYLLVTLAGFIALRKHPKRLTILAAVVVGLPLLTVLISFWRPILMSRVVLWPLPMLAIVVAFGVFASRQAGWQIATLVLILAIQGFGLHQYYTHFDKDEPWDQATAFLDQAHKPGDKIAVWPSYLEMPFGYYRSPGLEDQPLYLVTDSKADEKHLSDDFNRRHGVDRRHVAYDDLDDLFEPSQRVWLVIREREVELPPELGLAPQDIVESHRFDAVRVYLIAR